MAEKKVEPKSGEVDEPKCGLIMPISSLDGCSEQHWADVKSILVETLEDIGFQAELVSEADDVGIIQKRIIQNVYENPIVVCDVSGKNPNVMFELGMRLAFDKPTVIIKDDRTDYSFDTSQIEHIEYPRDLRFTKVIEFKQKLRDKVKGTYEASKKSGYTTFLKHFGKFKVAKLETEEVDKEDFLLSEMSDLKRLVMRNIRNSSRPVPSQPDIFDRHKVSPEECREMINEAVVNAINVLDAKGIKMDSPRASSRILNLARKDGALPICFDTDSSACQKLLKREMSRVLSST